jgi:ribosome-binding protein aMBF1 (putative translation factor)
MIDNYVTGAQIKMLRENKKLTQEELAQKINVTAKAVSKWETGNGFPDISLLESLAAALGISVIELLSGSCVRNQNKNANIAKSKFYVCPVCGNVITSTGEAVISCCGITLPPQTPEESDDDHKINIEVTEDEYFVSLDHPMTKEHYISFIAAVADNGIQFEKLYPEGPCEARFKISRVKKLLAYCNKDGLCLACPN